MTQVKIKLDPGQNQNHFEFEMAPNRSFLSHQPQENMMVPMVITPLARLFFKVRTTNAKKKPA